MVPMKMDNHKSFRILSFWCLLIVSRHWWCQAYIFNWSVNQNTGKERADNGVLELSRACSVLSLTHNWFFFYKLVLPLVWQLSKDQQYRLHSSSFSALSGFWQCSGAFLEQIKSYSPSLISAQGWIISWCGGGEGYELLDKFLIFLYLTLTSP